MELLAMPSQVIPHHRLADLRRQALSRLNGHAAPTGLAAGAAAALGVLHDLASSPATAPKALALLHELQVHQVELELQAEELRSSRVELEADLVRQTQLYDFAPVACFTVERDTTLCELNLAGAQMLGIGRDAPPGRALDSFFAPDDSEALHTLLARAAAGRRGEACTLSLTPTAGSPKLVHARADADPAGPRFLVALFEAVVTPPFEAEAGGRIPS
jgi:PAS domain-containing protein